MAKLVFAEPQHILAKLGGFPRTVRAIAAIDDAGLVLGVAGYFEDMGCLVMFIDAEESVWLDKRMVVRGGRQLMDLVRRRAMPVLALASRNPEGPQPLLEHWGFERISGPLFGLRR